MEAERAPTSFTGTYKHYIDTNTVFGVDRVLPPPFYVQWVMWFVTVWAGVCATASADGQDTRIPGIYLPFDQINNVQQLFLVY
jgi:hypothetical protein